MRSRNTIEYLGVWEQLNNPVFKSIEFDAFRNQVGLNSFSLHPKISTDTLKHIIIPKLSLMRGLFAESFHNSSI